MSDDDEDQPMVWSDGDDAIAATADVIAHVVAGFSDAAPAGAVPCEYSQLSAVACGWILILNQLLPLLHPLQ